MTMYKTLAEEINKKKTLFNVLEIYCYTFFEM